MARELPPALALAAALVGFSDVLAFLIAMAQDDWNRGFAIVSGTGRRDRSGRCLYGLVKRVRSEICFAISHPRLKSESDFPRFLFRGMETFHNKQSERGEPDGELKKLEKQPPS
jgi:hypothetical protein